MHYLVTLGTFTWLWIHHHYSSPELFIFPNELLQPLNTNSPGYSPLQPSPFYFSLWVWLFWMPHISGIIQCLSSVLHMVIHMFQCYFLKTSYSCLLPHSPKVSIPTLEPSTTQGPTSSRARHTTQILQQHRTIALSFNIQAAQSHSKPIDIS